MDTANRLDAPQVHTLASEAMAGGLRTPSYGMPDDLHYENIVDGRTAHCADPKVSDS